MPTSAVALWHTIWGGGVEMRQGGFGGRKEDRRERSTPATHQPVGSKRHGSGCEPHRKRNKTWLQWLLRNHRTPSIGLEVSATAVGYPSDTPPPSEDKAYSSSKTALDRPDGHAPAVDGLLLVKPLELLGAPYLRGHVATCINPRKPHQPSSQKHKTD